MKLAKLASEQWISAEEFSRKSYKEQVKLAVYCPKCHQPLLFKQGPRIRPYFAHKQSKTSQTIFNNEGELHRKNKLIIAELLYRNGYSCHVEERIELSQRRADIYVAVGNQKLAIELQYSPISLVDLTMRTKDYYQAQVPVRWLLGRASIHYKPNQHIPNMALQFLHYHSQYGLYVPFWCEKRQLVYLQFISYYRQCTLHAYVTIDEYLQINGQLIIQQPILKGELNKEEIPYTPLLSSTKQQMITRYQHNKQRRFILEACYMNKMIFAQVACPYLSLQGQSIFTIYKDWEIIVLVLIEFQQLSLNDFEYYYQFLVNQSYLLPYKTLQPTMTRTWLRQLISYALEIQDKCGK